MAPPAPTGAPTKERLIESTVELFRRQGYSGTGLKAILAAAQAPFGSLYHFFPGGKEELGVAALRAGGATYRELVEAIFAEGVDVATATANFFEGAALVVEATGYADACPIATVALEVASTNEPMRNAAADVFESWLVVLRQRFTAAGIPEPRARELAIEFFCAIEGAFLLSRTTRSVEPISIAGRAAVATVHAALSEVLTLPVDIAALHDLQP
jgi:TetR/AcrR family transcriptional regulator, lmrAB and yxaGH operons repressor